MVELAATVVLASWRWAWAVPTAPTESFRYEQGVRFLWHWLQAEGTPGVLVVM
jgi:hypothetical protein